MKQLVLAFVLAATTLPALSQPATLIDGVQLPAWREREASAAPATAGKPRVREELREAGYPAEVQRGKDAEKTSFMVRIRHLRTREEAQMLADQLAGKYGVKEPTVIR